MASLVSILLIVGTLLQLFGGLYRSNEPIRPCQKRTDSDVYDCSNISEIDNSYGMFIAFIPGPTDPVPAIIKGGHPTLQQRTYPSFKRIQICNRCFPYNYSTVISPKVCKDRSPVDLFILITTVPSAARTRDTIRSTWASYAKNNTADVRYLFLIGTGWNQTGQELIQRESEKHADILQHDYLDSYFNLSLKVLSGFHYVERHCSRAKWIMRGADDIFVSVPDLLAFIRAKGTFLKDNMFGDCLEYGGIVMRSRNNKWFVSGEEWPGWIYPPYCFGTSFIMSFGTMRKVIDMSPNVPYFVMEDVYFGLVLQALGIKVSDQEGFCSLGKKIWPMKRCKHPLRAVHGVTASRMKEYWLSYQRP